MTDSDTPSHSGGALSRLHVLVVDDNDFFLDIVTQLLNTIPVGQVTRASDVASAHTALRNDPRPVDCVICDEVMPQASGLEFLKVIRRGQIKQLPSNIAFIMCTGTDDPRIEAAAQGLDVTAFIKKPLSAQALRHALQRAVSHWIKQDTAKYERVPLPDHNKTSDE